MPNVTEPRVVKVWGFGEWMQAESLPGEDRKEVRVSIGVTEEKGLMRVASVVLLAQDFAAWANKVMHMASTDG